jgi:hypothetical protein
MAFTRPVELPLLDDDRGVSAYVTHTSGPLDDEQTIDRPHLIFRPFHWIHFQHEALPWRRCGDGGKATDEIE